MFQNAPHVRQSESVLTIMTDVVVALIPLYVMSFFYYGARAVVLGICGAASCLVFSAVAALVLGERPNLRDLTPIITGLIIPLLMPADISYGMVISACAVDKEVDLSELFDNFFFGFFDFVFVKAVAPDGKRVFANLVRDFFRRVEVYVQKRDFCAALRKRAGKFRANHAARARYCNNFVT